MKYHATKSCWEVDVYLHAFLIWCAHTPENESLVPDMRLGGLDAEQKRNTSVAAGNPVGRDCLLINEGDQCHCFTLNMAVRVRVQEGI
jgi:hypothetical protein